MIAFPFQAASAVPPGHMRIPSQCPTSTSHRCRTLTNAVPLNGQPRPVLSSSKTRSMPPKATSLGFQSVDAAIQIKRKPDKVAAHPSWDTLTATGAGRGVAMATTKFPVRQASMAPLRLGRYKQVLPSDTRPSTVQASHRLPLPKTRRLSHGRPFFHKIRNKSSS